MGIMLFQMLVPMVELVVQEKLLLLKQQLIMYLLLVVGI